MAQQFWQKDVQVAPPAGGGGPQLVVAPTPPTQAEQEGEELTNTGKRVGIQDTSFDNKRALRDEFNTLPLVKNYENVLAGAGGAIRAPDDAQGDLAVLYAFSQTMDPGSVVRESESEMAQRTASTLAQLKQKYNMVTEGARLPDGVRAGLVEAMRQKIRTINDFYSSRYAQYRDLAGRNGFDPEEITGQHLGDTFRPIEEEYIRSRGGTPRSNWVAVPAESPRPNIEDISFNGDGPPPPEWTAFQADLQRELATGNLTTADQIIGFGRARNFTIDPEQARAAAEGMAKGVMPRVDVPKPRLTAEEQALVDERVAGVNGVEAGVAGVADTLTMGGLDKAGAAIDAFGGAMSGEGSFGDLYERGAMVNDAYLEGVQDAHPIWYAGGQIAGGLALPMFSARSAAELAKVGAAYSATYGVGSSDSLAEVPGNVATGAALGAGAGWAGGKLAQKLGERAARRVAEEVPPSAKEAAESAAERYARAERFGVEPTLDAVGGRGSKIVGQTLSNMPASAQVMNAARKGMAAQVDDAVEGVAGTYGPSTNFPGVGEAAQKGARQWISRFEEVSGKAYDAIPISPKAPARLDHTRQALGELTSIFESNPKMAETFANTRLNRYLDALADGGEGLSWNDLKAFRSRVGEEIGEQRFSDSPTKGELRRLYGALSEDMKATARQMGPKAEAAFERANTLYRQGQQRIDEALVKILGDDGKMSPEKAAARIQTIVTDGRATTDLKAIHEIWKSLPTGERGEVANGLIRLMGQPLNKEGREFSAQTFMKNFGDMTPASKNLIFGAADKELRSNLDDFAAMIGDFAERDSLRNTSNTAGQALTGLAFYSVGNLPALIGQAATSYGAARLMTSPKFVRWATGYAKMLKGAEKAGKTPTEQGFKTHATLLEKLAAAEPALAQDIVPLRDAILRGANDNWRGAGQVAASDDQRPQK